MRAINSLAATAAWKTCALVAASAVMGCTTSVGYTAPPPAAVATGTAVLDWTVNGGKDPAECQLSGGTTFQVTLYDSRGQSQEYVQSCSAFATTIDVESDTYTGSASLRDSAGAARTTTVSLAPFTVISGRAVTVAIDFPVNSFL